MIERNRLTRSDLYRILGLRDKERSLMVKVSYTVKGTATVNGLLVDKSVNFSTMSDAIRFIRSLEAGKKTNTVLVGKPMLEWV
jgi:hypothetical protein